MVTRTYILYTNLALHLLIWPWTALWTLIILFSSLIRFKTLGTIGLWLWANGIFWILLKRITVTGREHIEPGKNYLLVLNHTSMFDFPALMAVFPRVAWLGRDNLVKIPIFGRTLLSIDYIPIFPGDTERSKMSINSAIEKSSRINIAIFPEGTRTLDGSMKDFKKGFTYIVRDTKLDILPVTLNGLFTWKQKYQRYITPVTPLHIVIQKAIPNETLMALSQEEMAAEMKRIIEKGLIKD